jgi:hypothetical protein
LSKTILTLKLVLVTSSYCIQFDSSYCIKAPKIYLFCLINKTERSCLKINFSSLISLSQGQTSECQIQSAENCKSRAWSTVKCLVQGIGTCEKLKPHIRKAHYLNANFQAYLLTMNSRLEDPSIAYRFWIYSQLLHICSQITLCILHHSFLYYRHFVSTNVFASKVPWVLDAFHHYIVYWILMYKHAWFCFRLINPHSNLFINYVIDAQINSVLYSNEMWL